MLNAVKFDFFGKPRNLRYDINAIADIERETKTSIIGLLSAERLGFDTIRVFLWAGLKHEDQSLSVIKVGNHIQKYAEENGKNMIAVIGEFTEPILNAMKVGGLMGDDSEGNLKAEGTEN